jgi:branched-subunit amino acid aminotransferase/4-amino-4-deoxychorismate lyase
VQSRQPCSVHVTHAVLICLRGAAIARLSAGHAARSKVDRPRISGGDHVEARRCYGRGNRALRERAHGIRIERRRRPVHTPELDLADWSRDLCIAVARAREIEDDVVRRYRVRQAERVPDASITISALPRSPLRITGRIGSAHRETCGCQLT